MAAMYKSPPCMDRLALPAIWTALLVMDMVKPESPSARILQTRFLPNANCFGESRIIVFFPVRKVNVHKAAINCEITVARAAPCTPSPSKKIKTGSNSRLQTAPMETVSMPVFAKPCALINEFKPRLNITKTEPHR